MNYTDISKAISNLIVTPAPDRKAEDVENLKQMVKSAKDELSRLESIIQFMTGDITVSEPKTTEESPKRRIPAPDGKTHAQAILDVLTSSKDGMTAGDLRAALADAKHPMDSGVLGTTLSNLHAEHRIAKKQDPSSKGKQRKTYIYRSV